jgi:hypothetical protein
MEVVMAEKRIQKTNDETKWLDENELVLLKLQELIKSVTSPIIKTCLEEAHEDIAYLTATDTPAIERSAVA